MMNLGIPYQGQGIPVGYHASMRTGSMKPVAFDEFVAVESRKGVESTMIKAHGILGIIAWFACAPVGMIFAR
jgi:hypothetical protein